MTTPATVDAKLADRYGSARTVTRRRIAVVLAVVVLVAVLGYVGWSTVVRAINSVDVDTTAYAVTDETQVTVHFTVTSEPGTPVACAVEAQDEDHAVVGWKVVTEEGSTDHSRTFAVTVPTTALAATGFVAGCWIP